MQTTMEEDTVWNTYMSSQVHTRVDDMNIFKGFETLVK